MKPLWMTRLCAVGMCCGAVLAPGCRTKLADPNPPDLLCGVQVAWYAAPASGTATDPNSADPNAAGDSAVICCPDSALLTETDQDTGSVYRCCPVPSALGATTGAQISCCPSNLVTQVSQDDAPYGYYDPYYY